MNAYEIADELQKHGLNGDNYGLFNKRIQNMLRQQADRIAELEETIEACYAVQKMQAEEVYKGNDRIAELEKLLEHSVGSDCREMRYIQEIENKDARIAELEKWEERWSKRCQRQQDELAELEKQLKHYKNKAEYLDKRELELLKQAKPVAWMEYIQDEEWEVWYTEPTDLPEGHSYKPLYLAPQTKPLSDEEIMDIAEQSDYSPVEIEMGYDYEIRIARAIEERHGIK